MWCVVPMCLPLHCDGDVGAGFLTATCVLRVPSFRFGSGHNSKPPTHFGFGVPLGLESLWVNQNLEKNSGFGTLWVILLRSAGCGLLAFCGCGSTDLTGGRQRHCKASGQQPTAGHRPTDQALLALLQLGCFTQRGVPPAGARASAILK